MGGLTRRSVRFETASGPLRGELGEPPDASDLVVFVTGNCGISNAPPERELANRLNEHGIATLAVDLLTPEEAMDRGNRGDIELLRKRISLLAAWLDGHGSLGSLDVGFYAAETAADAVLRFVNETSMSVTAIALRNGYSDLTVGSPTDIDTPVLALIEDNSAAEMTVAGGFTGDSNTEVLRVDSQSEGLSRIVEWYRDQLRRSEVTSRHH